MIYEQLENKYAAMKISDVQRATKVNNILRTKKWHDV